jgi:multidrug resistance efflux pump
MQQAEAQLALTEEKLARAQIVAPFDGLVVAGDLSQLLGSPVEQGRPLFEVAPLDAYRVILKVEDRDVRDVRAGQSGKLILAGLPGDLLDFEVRNISLAEADEGKNVFASKRSSRAATSSCGREWKAWARSTPENRRSPGSGHIG